jgi:hypothetical protein
MSLRLRLISLVTDAVNHCSAKCGACLVGYGRSGLLNSA